MPRLGFSSTSDFTCAFFRALDDRGSYGFEEFAQLCATAPTGPLTGVWMSQHTLPGSTSRAFPRLYPVAVIDDGTDVFVRSLPGTPLQLTMKLSTKYEYELSGPVGIHRPRESPSWDRAKQFHEHVRFRTPSRKYERLRRLDGEWQRADMLSLESHVRRVAAAGESSGREWRLLRCTTSLDWAILHQYVEKHVERHVDQHVDQPNSLLYPDAGAAWHAAVAQAARLLAPFSSEAEDDEEAKRRLACAALTVYALAYETLTAPAMVPVKDIHSTLRDAVKQLDDSDGSGEPELLKQRISEALSVTGQGPVRVAGASRSTMPPVYQLYLSRSTPDWHVGQDRPHLPVGPSDLARLLPWLLRRLS